MNCGGGLEVGLCRGARAGDLAPQHRDASQRLRPVEVHVGSERSGQRNHTVSKGLVVFPSPAGMSLTKLSLAGNNVPNPSPWKVWAQ